MITEYEATFPNIEKTDARDRLSKVGAKLIRSEFLQKRVVLDLPKERSAKGSFLRVRNEGDKTTLTLKKVGTGGIADQKEIMVTVDNFEATILLLETIGCPPLSHEESRRELWEFDGADVTIDEWPFLGSLVEVEGKSEEHVRTVSEKLSFDWNSAKFCAIGTLYVEKYGKGPIDLAKEIGTMTKLVFEGVNPFIK